MEVLGARAPARAPGVELLGQLSDSGYRDAPYLVRRSDGQSVQVTELLYQLLEVVDGERGLEQLAHELGQRCGKTVAPADVSYLLEEKLAPLGLIGAPDGSAPMVAKASPLLGLKFKVVASDPAVTSRITGPFAWLFRTAIVVPALLAFAVTVWWVLWERGLAGATRQAFESPGLLLAVFAITVLSAGWHEFGHAAACRAAGATPGAMGAGLYLMWPAFYTDVDDSYRLSRWGRLIVDLGGLYFNALLAVVVTGAWLVTRLEPLLLVVATQLLLMVRQLAPVIRADGYHILADLTGVPDLFQHIKPTMAGLLPQNWRKPQPLRPWARWVVRAWVLFVVPLLLWMLLLAVLLLPRLAATAWTGLQQQGGKLMAHAETGALLGVLSGVLKMLALALPVVAITYLLARVARRLAGTAWTRTEDRPLGRGLVSLTGMVLLALLLWAWWPAGQYHPVRANERGTIGQALQLRLAAAPAQLSERMTPALALVPRNDPSAPVLLLVRSEDDGPLQAVLTSSPEDPGDTSSARVLPFTVPDAAGEGDNQALATNTTNGNVTYDVAIALVKVVDGQRVDNRNEAFALASCERCATVAVAFQVVLVIGQSDVQIPVNTAVAANKDCVACFTTALAVQLVVTLGELPSAQVEAELTAAMAQLNDLQALASSLGAAEIYAQVQAVQSQILDILVRNGLVEPSTMTGGTIVMSSPSPAATGIPTAVASVSPTPDDTAAEPTPSEPAPAVSASEPAPSEAPQETASPQPS